MRTCPVGRPVGRRPPHTFALGCRLAEGRRGCARTSHVSTEIQVVLEAVLARDLVALRGRGMSSASHASRAIRAIAIANRCARLLETQGPIPERCCWIAQASHALRQIAALRFASCADGFCSRGCSRKPSGQPPSILEAASTETVSRRAAVGQRLRQRLRQARRHLLSDADRSNAAGRLRAKESCAHSTLRCDPGSASRGAVVRREWNQRRNVSM